MASSWVSEATFTLNMGVRKVGRTPSPAVVQGGVYHSAGSLRYYLWVRVCPSTEVFVRSWAPRHA